MIPESVRVEARRLFFAEHWKVGTIANLLDVHRDTVLRAIGSELFVSRGNVRPSAFDPYIATVREILAQYPRLSGKRVHEMLKARGYPGSVGQVRRRLRHLDLRPRKPPEAFLRLTTAPGEQAQVDWASIGKLRVGGIERRVYAFVLVFSWSRAFFVDFSFDQTMAAVVRGHARAFQILGGVPRHCLYDNMKTVVIARIGDAIQYHHRLLELAGHYHFAPRPCRPRRGNEKGRVERRIRDLRESFLAGRRFLDLADFQRQFEQWRDEVAYRRPCPADPTLTVAQAWAQERPRLLPLPTHPLEGQDTRATSARKQPYITYDRNLYSIPHTRVGLPLTLVATDSEVRILDGKDVVARHRRSWDARQVIEDPEHIRALREEKHAARHTTGRERILGTVPGSDALFAELVHRQEPIGPQTVILQRLLDEYGANALAQAIAAALERGTPRASSVEHLLTQQGRAGAKGHAVPVRLPERPDVQNLTIRNHDLESYDDL